MCACIEEMHSIINLPDPMVIITPLVKVAIDLGRPGGGPTSKHAQLIRCNNLTRGERQRDELFRLKSRGFDISLFKITLNTHTHAHTTL